MACADCGRGRFNEEMGMPSCFGCMETMTRRLQDWLWSLRNLPPKVNMPRLVRRPLDTGATLTPERLRKLQAGEL